RHEGIRWREFIYRISIKAIKQVEPVPLREKVLIADDTINQKRGKKIELASYIRDHTIGRTVLGMNHLVLSYFDEKSLFPLDFSIHNSSKRHEGVFS
ncbi:MAG: transposase, partial [Thermodesulfobacteriota bacterium]|nr:transposase [Thermodesulfobacteriota bacterium]